MKSLQVQDYLNTQPVTFTPDMVLEEASRKLTKAKQLGGPVIDTNGVLVGFLSEAEVLAKMLETSYYREHIASVKDLMRTDVLSMKPNTSIVELAQLMLQNKPKMYPVIDDSGKLLGTISRNDVLGAIGTHLHDTFQVTQKTG